MELCRDYFPTRAYRIAEMRLGSLLGGERDRLDLIAEKLGRDYAIGLDNLKEELPNIISFAREYHAAYDSYLKAVLPQQDKPIQCRAACGNCCHHYPMSVEPFELIFLYQELRKSDDLITVMESKPRTRPSMIISRSGFRARFRTGRAIAAFTGSARYRAACTLARRTRASASPRRS